MKSTRSYLSITDGEGIRQYCAGMSLASKIPSSPPPPLVRERGWVTTGLKGTRNVYGGYP